MSYGIKNEEAEAKTPSEWQKEVDFTVIDPDGWRTADIPWEQPISRALFDKLAAQSTCDFSKARAGSARAGMRRRRHRRSLRKGR